MSTNRGIALLLIVALFGLNACVAPGPRDQVAYHDGSQQSYSSRYCNYCGTVRDVDQVQVRRGSSSGGGAVLGAIIGGVIGNQFGHGSGRAAATAAGVVAGAAVGDSIEQDQSRLASGYAWRFHVQLDDGRWATVTQHNNPGFRPGDRVYINRDHLEFMRR